MSNEAKKEVKGTAPKVELNPKFKGTMEPPVVTVERAPGETPAKKGRKVSVTRGADKFVALKAVGEGDKMPLQCKQIMGILNDAKDKALSREALLEAMKLIIATRQPIERILGFYQSRLVSGNWARIEGTAKVEKPKVEKKETTTAVI